KDPNHEVAVYASSTGVSNLRKHLMREHTQDWEKGCEEMGIKITAGAALEYLNKIERTVGRDIPPYSKEAFANALAEFIMADDIPINVMESPQLRNVFFLLRRELKDKDIPGRAAMRSHIMDMFYEHLEKLGEEMKVSSKFLPLLIH
ncbi:hypothetical protein F5887DRAFT_893710, partial [Amanita rubescens]